MRMELIADAARHVDRALRASKKDAPRAMLRFARVHLMSALKNERLGFADAADLLLNAAKARIQDARSFA